MPYAVSGTVWEASLYFTQANHRNAVILHYKQGAGAVEDADVAAVVNGFTSTVFNAAAGSNAVVRKMLECMVSQSTFVEGKVQALTQPVHHQPIPIATAITSGTRIGEALPPQAAMLIRKQTLGPGRSGSGRSFIPGWSEADQDNGLWLTVGAMIAPRNAMLTALQASFGVPTVGVPAGLFFYPCVWSRKNLQGYNTTAWLAQATVRNQRRRSARTL